MKPVLTIIILAIVAWFVIFRVDDTSPRSNAIFRISSNDYSTSGVSSSAASISSGVRMLYFAYGSNMSRPRIEKRIGNVRVESTATVPDHRLAFSKVGRDGSGKCCFSETIAGDRVHGVLFGIEDRQLRALDRAEGLGRGYDRVRRPVLLQGGTWVEAVTYVATVQDPSLRPFSWYLRHVVHGAIDAGLPASYVAAIRGTETVEDPDRSREAVELAVYDFGGADPIR